MKQQYQEFRFNQATLNLIGTIEGICDEYANAGFVLTVRQLYYQLVSRDILPNTEKSYKRVTSVVNDARLAGLIDWDIIEDRTRSFIRRTRWDDGAQILRASSDSFHMDMWETQEVRVFVIVEKEALAGVLEGVCKKYDVPLLAARGYPSGTVLREFAQTDLLTDADKAIQIYHLGDHDPSGIDMSRDLQERIALFAEHRASDIVFERIALNMDQIEEQNPPPNPAKTTDARFESYRGKHGDESWELDALKPEYLVELVERHINACISKREWNARVKEVEDIKTRIRKAAKGFES